MHPSFVRRDLGTLIPPKIATPNSLASGGGASLQPLVEFYGKLPKGPKPLTDGYGVKARYFNGRNASGKPLVALIGGMLLFSYTLAYNLHLKHHKNHPH